MYEEINQNQIKTTPERLKVNYNLRKRNNTGNMYNRYGSGNKLYSYFLQSILILLGISMAAPPWHQKEKNVAGYAIVSDTEIIESQPLPWGTSSQKAEFITLTRALILAANKRANINTDSKYSKFSHHPLTCCHLEGTRALVY